MTATLCGCCVLVWMLAASTGLAVTLELSPQHQSLTTGSPGSVSINLAENVDLRLLELWIQYDPQVIQHLDCSAGSLFTALGTSIFTQFQVEEPGLVHAYIATQGTGTHTSGAGELLVWDFIAHDDGLSTVSIIGAKLYDAAGTLLPDIDTPPGSVLVSQTQNVELWTAPNFQMISVGDTASVSILLTDTLEVRSIEVWVDYDPTIIGNVSGGPGDLFLAQPCYLWQDFELIEPGSWHGYAVIIGHDCFITTPGELLTWTFTGLADGTSPITSVDVDLYDADGLPIDVVSLRSGTVRVVPGGSVILYTTPEDQTLEVEDLGTISVELQLDLEIRSVELWVEYDPAVVEHRQGSPGQLFKNLPCITWTDFELVSPGLWHAFAVIMGYDCWTTGPGEVMSWEFRALAPGVSPVTSFSADLYAINGQPIPDVYQTPATIEVTYPVGSVNEPAMAAGRLEIYPNPFNPSVTLRLPATGDRPAAVSVIDAKGRRVRDLWQGRTADEAINITWDGRNDQGQALPSGQYLFIMQHSDGHMSSARGTLLR